MAVVEVIKKSLPLTHPWVAMSLATPQILLPRLLRAALAMEPFNLVKSIHVHQYQSLSLFHPDFGENMDQFKRASPSMFEQSMSSPALDEEEHARARGGASGGSSENVNTSSSDQPDFMANQQVAWINGKPVDSGFISPASASRHSDPDEAGRHEARPDVDDELEESREVTELLAKVSGGQLPKEMMEFHKKISTPEDVSSSEEEDGGTTLHLFLFIICHSAKSSSLVACR